MPRTDDSFKGVDGNGNFQESLKPFTDDQIIIANRRCIAYVDHGNLLRKAHNVSATKIDHSLVRIAYVANC